MGGETKKKEENIRGKKRKIKERKTKQTS